ncbi:transposase [Robiginitalea marina]|uniref:transposase n=1 Tax=Robiginitalea marina TaxID=2954105 RepID=UPI0035191DB6
MVTCVTGVGKITALYLTIITNFFKRYDNPKQLAFHCGVARFEYTSGTSPHKLAKTHHMANRV